jgi:hypothetical protein
MLTNPANKNASKDSLRNFWKNFLNHKFIFSAKLLIFMKCAKKCLIILAILCIAIIAFSVLQGLKGEKEKAIEACISLCRSKLKEGLNISSGPCLSNEIIPNWVCDVAHWPRENVDNLKENQCSAYLQGLANHFVEVDTTCKLIRAI